MTKLVHSITVSFSATPDGRSKADRKTILATGTDRVKASRACRQHANSLAQIARGQKRDVTVIETYEDGSRYTFEIA